MAKSGTTRRASDIQEARIQKQFGGVRPANSGGGTFKKGDVLLDDLFIDGKTAMSLVKSKSVKKAELDKAREQAFYSRKSFYALVLSFGDGKDYFVIPADDFKLIYEGYKAGGV